MADIALPPPTPFLALPGEPPIPWTRWLQSFETFILAVGLTDMSAARKKALLLHCLGAEGQRVLGALESGTTSDYNTAVELLNAHFAAPQNALLRRFLFRHRHQLPGESVQQYVANLRGFVRTCKFGALQEEMIRDQLIEHTNDAKVRETLLLEPDDLSLSRAITIALRIERAAACASALTKQQTIAARLPTPTPHDTIDVTTQPGRYIGGSRFLCSYATEATTAISATPTGITAFVINADLHLICLEHRTAQPVARHAATVVNAIILPQSAAPLQLCQPKHPLSFTMSTLHQSHLKHVQYAWMMCASHCFWTLVPVFLSWICKHTTLFSEHWHCRHPLLHSVAMATQRLT